MIPKKIHYVWVGDQPKPESVIEYIEGWKRLLPSYEIIEWNNDSLKTIDNIYCNQAFQNKKWAFVSDYLRLFALYTQGGIYLDTDVEITQSLDKFLDLNFFSGYEDYYGMISPITAVMGSIPVNNIIKELLEEYSNERFEYEGKLNLTTNTARISNYFKQKYSASPPYSGNSTLELEKGAIIFPSFYFCTPQAGKENFAIHKFNASWQYGFRRTNWFSFKSLTISHLKKIKHINKTTIPISDNEALLFRLPIAKTRQIAIIFTKKSTN